MKGPGSVTRPGSILVTGGEGRLASTVVPGLARAGWEVRALGRDALDVTDRDAVAACVRALRPTALLNLAAWTDLERCERHVDQAEAINAHAVAHLRDAVAEVGGHLVHISSDYVFDGGGDAPYTEDDPTEPLNVYGATKVRSEAAAGPGATVLRTAWISGRHGRCLVRAALDAAFDPARPASFVDDQLGSPTVADELVAVIDRVAGDRTPGLFHAAGTGAASPHDIASFVFELVGADPGRLRRVALADQIAGAPRRPAYSVLASERLAATGVPVPGDWRESTAALVHAMRAPSTR